MQALYCWQAAAGPYWLYVCAAPFVSAPPTLVPDHRPRRRRRSWLRLLPPLLDREPTAIFVDLPPADTLPATRALTDRGLAVVPIIQRWLATPAVLSGERLAADLIAYSSTLGPVDPPAGVAFLLDGDRAGPTRAAASPARPRPAPDRFDNRYGYPICRFPPPALLGRQGIGQVYWLAPAGIAPDLHSYARALAEAGLPPQIVVVPSHRPLTPALSPSGEREQRGDDVASPPAGQRPADARQRARPGGGARQ